MEGRGKVKYCEKSVFPKIYVEDCRCNLSIATELCVVTIYLAAGPKVEIISNSTLNISDIARSVILTPNVPSLCISRK